MILEPLFGHLYDTLDTAIQALLKRPVPINAQIHPELNSEDLV